MSEIKIREKKPDLIIRMNKIEGQVKGIKKMIERDVYCDDVLIQLSAVQSALSSVSKLILKDHMQTCVVNKIKNEDPKIIEEFFKTLDKMIK